jgi:hypothetical protein
MSRYDQIDFDKRFSDEDREWLRGRSRSDLIEENDRKFPAKGKKASEDAEPPYEPPYSVAPPVYDPDVQVEDQSSADFHIPTPVPPRPGDRVDGSAEARGEGPLVVAEEEAEVEELNVEELKEELRSRELPVSGDKKELQKRLNKALKDEEGK